MGHKIPSSVSGSGHIVNGFMSDEAEMEVVFLDFHVTVD